MTYTYNTYKYTYYITGSNKIYTHTWRAPYVMTIFHKRMMTIRPPRCSLLRNSRGNLRNNVIQLLFQVSLSVWQSEIRKQVWFAPVTYLTQITNKQSKHTVFESILVMWSVSLQESSTSAQRRTYATWVALIFEGFSVERHMTRPQSLKTACC